MDLSTKNLTDAKETVGQLLDQLGLSAYLFEIEPDAERWKVRVECPRNSGWQSSLLMVDDNMLRACRTDRFARDHLLGEWRERLTARDAG
jgi:hypothetical protein